MHAASPHPLQHSNYVPPEHLATVATWLARLRQDKPYSAFHLIQLDFGPGSAWGAAYGARRGVTVLEEFGKRLASALRNTDLVSRTSAAFWVIAPPDDMDPVLQRLHTLMDDFFKEASPTESCTLSCYALNGLGLSENGLRSLLEGTRTEPPRTTWQRTWQPAAS